MAKAVKKPKPRTVYAALRRKFRTRDGRTRKTPIDRLMYAMLVQRSPQQDAERGFSFIQRTYVDWNEFRVASIRDLAVLIKAKGCSPASGENMKRLLQSLYQETHGVPISPIQKMSYKHAREYLQRAAGMSAEHAAGVLTTAFDMPLLRVQNAIKRVLTRLRMVPENGSERRFSETFRKMAVKGRASTVHRVLLMLIRGYCRKENPLCPRCPIKKHCATGHEREQQQKEDRIARKKTEQEKRAKDRAAARKKEEARKKAAIKKKSDARKKAAAKKKTGTGKQTGKKKKTTTKSVRGSTRKPKAPRRAKK